MIYIYIFIYTKLALTQRKGIKYCCFRLMELLLSIWFNLELSYCCRVMFTVQPVQL